MTEEEKKCDCNEKCCKRMKEFLFISGAVFVGGTLAILLGTAMTRPKMPPMPPMQPNVNFERQMQPLPTPMGFEGQMPPQNEFHNRGQRHEKFRPQEFQGKPQPFDSQKSVEPPINAKK